MLKHQELERSVPKVKVSNRSVVSDKSLDREPVSRRLRRCHVCGHIEDVIASQVKSCGSCGKVFAPFFYSSQDVTGLVVDESAPGRESTSTSHLSTYRPLVGFTLLWETDRDETLSSSVRQRTIRKVRAKTSVR